MHTTDLLVRRDDHRRCEVRESEFAPLREGQARFRVDRFALTSNNVTYALLGDVMGYWGFYPAEDGWGQVPAWGFAEVIESATGAVAVGDRFYGYWPMSSHAILEPVAHGGPVVDDAEHRRALPAMYNNYLPASAPDAHTEELQSLIRPLFASAWLIDDFLAAQGFRDAATVLITSASSKTAAATAWCLARRAERPALVGLTSAANTEFVAGLAGYDRAVAYSDIASADLAGPVMLIDIAGSADIRRAVHERFGDGLSWTLGVGGTHMSEISGLAAPQEGGGESEIFFAPTYLEQRTAEIGSRELPEMISGAESEYLEGVARTWPITRASEPDAVRAAWIDQVDGKRDPAGGTILSLVRS
ncbi:DUF2855 family protein [Herbihabitans rhizosphaerae]|uniref:DUF2855 family protein n=1 Tax=Herbihabitans rhizosphaerae TaxID=1872711 RepID=UPI0013EEBE78|nr:DUF2855 family protein [Herbihabitans rhizosphaerae]